MAERVETESLDLQHLGQPPRVTLAAGIGGIEEGVDDLEGKFGTDDPSTNAQDIHVIVLHALMRRVGVVTNRRADARNLVGRDTHPLTAAANDDPAICPPVDQLAGDRHSKIGIVAALLGMGSTIQKLGNLTGKTRGHCLFEPKSGMVATQGDA